MEKRKTFITESNIAIGSAILPDDYSVIAKKYDEWQCDFVPFSTLVKATNKDNSIWICTTGREMYEDCINKKMKILENMVPGDKSYKREFMEPEEFLTKEAERICNAPVEAIDKTTLPSVYGRNLEKVKQEQLNFFLSHQININVQIEPSTVYADSILMRFKTKVNDMDAYALVGCDYRGIEKYDASNMAAVFGGMGNLSNLAGGLGNVGENLVRAFNPDVDKEPEPGSGIKGFLKGGGLVGKMMRDKAKNKEPNSNKEKQINITQNNEEVRFGHGKDSGKKVDYIEWGVERVYACVYRPEKENEALQTYINFVASFTPDENLEKTANQLIEQKYQVAYQQAVQLAGIARQKQFNSAMFAQQTARNISNQMSSISDGIMDSWNQKMASDSRISKNFSEAIRGVNTYTDLNGKSFEFTNQADHVYTNQYGDHIGVSGNEIDQDILNRMNWTKVNKE